MIRNGGIQKNLKSQTQSSDSNLRPLCEGSGKTKYLPTLAPRVEARNETRNLPRGGREVWVTGILRLRTLSQTNLGTSVNSLPNFSTKMGGRTSLRANGIAGLLVNAHLDMLIVTTHV
ncbi:hypothetical protein AVEN_71867-1 [Araneus ventricosus]|uniref:Uncharacterized protein n=1 Tax=Araneus ventricosus TaxID=182803 RepID=A0A4Y2BSX9_ARAVE|nr:hypothetical protein AVEN_40332-1 [Araneus ventricosus]GBL94737.1 hypothetical protein AVEN_71867-1 [Araneus ventricosus]